MGVTPIWNALYGEFELSFKMFQSRHKFLKGQILHVQGELDIHRNMSDQVLKTKVEKYDAEDTTLWNALI